MIYFFDSYGNLSLQEAIKLLDENRLQKFNRLKVKRDKENCAAAYLLLIKALKDIGIENAEIFYNENGKPYFKNKNLYFNISHCNCGVAVAVSKEEIGIDIQPITPYNNGVAKRVFSPDEREFAESSENPDEAFTQIWTLKESIIKCKGETLANLSKYTFENEQEAFTKYNKNFYSFREKNLMVSVCGTEDFSCINKIKFVEELP